MRSPPSGQTRSGGGRNGLLVRAILANFRMLLREAGGVPYPGRRVHDTLPQFVGTNGVKQTAQQRAALLSFVATQYAEGRSLRELAELTGRTQSAVRRALDQAGVRRRGPGAAKVWTRDDD